MVDKALPITAISRPRQFGELAVALIPSVAGKSCGEAWRAISLTHMTRDPSGPSLHINTWQTVILAKTIFFFACCQRCLSWTRWFVGRDAGPPYASTSATWTRPRKAREAAVLLPSGDNISRCQTSSDLSWSRFRVIEVLNLYQRRHFLESVSSNLTYIWVRGSKASVLWGSGSVSWLSSYTALPCCRLQRTDAQWSFWTGLDWI